MIFDGFANLKYKYGNRHFWCRGYFVDTVGRNKTAIQKYIQNQLTEDQVCVYGNSGRNQGRRYVTLSRWEYPKTWQCKRVIPDMDIGSQRIQLQ